MNVILNGIIYAITYTATREVINTAIQRKKNNPPSIRKRPFRTSSQLLPNFPLGYFRNDGQLYDVRDFVDPQSVSGIANSLWAGDEFNFVLDSSLYVVDNVAYKSDRGEFWKTPR